MPSESHEYDVPIMDTAMAFKKQKLGVLSGVTIPVFLNVFSILAFLRFGAILGQIGLLGILGLLVVAYLIDLVTALSLSAIASNGEVKGGGAYYLISRSLGPEFGGSIGVLFYLSQVLNTSLNVVGLIDCLKLNLGSAIPQGRWKSYGIETCALLACTTLCLAGSAIFAKASNGLLIILSIAIISIPISAIAKAPFSEPDLGIEFTGISSRTLFDNLYPHTSESQYDGLQTFRNLFGILFSATSGIFAGASMSGDLRNPSKSIPKGTLWAMLLTFIVYVVVILSMASTITHASFLQNANVISKISLWEPIILAGECAVTFFSALMGLVAAAKLLQALARDRIIPGLSVFSQGTTKGDEPLLAIFFTYIIAQIALFADLNQIATFISMGYQMTFFVMNLACFLLKIGSAPNFRPAFHFFSWHTAFLGAFLSAAAMFFVNERIAATAICVLVFLFLLIHYMSPPKHWGDVSQNLIYHQVRKYLLRLKPEHIKFWRPQIILLINDPRHHTRLIQFCNSMKKGALYILGHAIVADDFNTGIHEAKLQQAAWTKYISEFSRIKAFVQLTMTPSIEWGIRNLILSAGLGGMRPNIAVLGFYNLDELRKLGHSVDVPSLPNSPTKSHITSKTEGKAPRRRRGDTSARLMEGHLPTDAIKTEGLMSPKSYLTILEDLALRHRLNVAIAKGFQALETPRPNGTNTKKYIDLWPIQMSAEITADDKNVLTTNFDTYTLILQLGYILMSVKAWRQVYRLRVLVFVEYESEVEEERARLKALLEQLRIEADIVVFWLASDTLHTYEEIVNGNNRDDTTSKTVNDILKDDEWWQGIQKVRGQASEMSQSQFVSLSEILANTTGRRGSQNIHLGSGLDDSGRRSSTNEFLELPKKPTVQTISRLGVNVGIHTHNLVSHLLDGQHKHPNYPDSDAESSSASSSDADFNELEDTNSEEETMVTSRKPIFTFGSSKKRGSIEQPVCSFKKQEAQDQKQSLTHAPGLPNYGTMETPKITLPERSEGPGASDRPKMASVPHSLAAVSKDVDEATTPQTSASRITSGAGPVAEVTSEEGLSTRVMFDSETNTAPSRQRPTFSRQSSMGRFSSRPVPETQISTDETGTRITFAETPLRSPIASRAQSRAQSRRNSLTHDDGSSDLHVSIPKLLESYRIDSQAENDVAATYSTQSLPLSFNDLPSRAQHLILNELMRRHSNDTAVLLTTLPIPEEGICKNEEASVRYLSDVEVLCHELPPVLLVLSNNMTVTVSL